MQLRNGVRLIPGGSGIEELANLPVARNTLLMAQLQVLESSSDFMIVDCAAGIGENVTGILLAASQVVIVAMPEPPSIVDAYATMKVISRHAPDKKISLVVNNVSGISEAGQIYKQLSTASDRFLKQKIEFLGAIPQDAQLVEAVCNQIPVVEYAPDAAASRAIKIIARELNEEFLQPAARGTKSFWNTLISQSQI
jgi:flagellar biosynthesis protein FlhG